MSMKNPLTPAGIEPATYRFVAHHLNHCATAVPQYKKYIIYLKKGVLSKLTQLELFSAYFDTPNYQPHGTTRMLTRWQKKKSSI